MPNTRTKKRALRAGGGTVVPGASSDIQKLGAGPAGRIRNDKSLAPYRDCLGGEFTGMMRCLDRGSFDRDDLKEAAGAAVRAPSYGAASLLFWVLGWQRR
jgi:hypothetical protein